MTSDSSTDRLRAGHLHDLDLDDAALARARHGVWWGLVGPAITALAARDLWTW